MRRTTTIGAARRAGMTLVELLFALVILAGLMVLVFQLLDRTLSVWRKSETQGSVLGQASSVADLFAHDLRGLENGGRGDLLLEWARFDTDGDSVPETKWPRLRLVRQASSAEVARLAELAALERGVQPAGAEEGRRVLRASPGLVEVLWLVAPASLIDKDARAEGLLWRGERLADDSASKSFFAPDFFGTSGRPPAGATEELCGGVLWFRVLCAAQTSVVHDGWQPGRELADAATSWDAWGRGRPAPAVHPWNEKHAGMPAVRDRPALPRRVRLELEIERPADRLRRTRLTENIELGDARLPVDDVARLPEPGSFVLVDAEWMELVSADGQGAIVRRGARGTTPLSHAREALVHFGAPLVREVVVTTAREDWNP